MRTRPFLVALGISALALAGGFGGQKDAFRRERSGESAALKDSLEGKAPPKLVASDWLNSKALDWSSLKGKVVVLDFWTFWCGPCRAATPHTKELYEKYKDKGLVVIGVHSDANWAEGKKAVQELGISWPVAQDGKGELLKAFHCDSFPDYCLVDRKGVLRFCDLANGEVDKAVELLISED